MTGKENQNIGHFTFRLFSEPSFLDGFVSMVNFEKLMKKYNTDETDALADGNAIKSDWEAVGSDIRCALFEYERGSISNS